MWGKKKKAYKKYPVGWTSPGKGTCQRKGRKDASVGSLKETVVSAKESQRKETPAPKKNLGRAGLTLKRLQFCCRK